MDRQILGEILCGYAKTEGINFKCNPKNQPDCKPFMLAEKITEEIYELIYWEI